MVNTTRTLDRTNEKETHVYRQKRSIIRELEKQAWFDKVALPLCIVVADEIGSAVSLDDNSTVIGRIRSGLLFINLFIFSGKNIKTIFRCPFVCVSRRFSHGLPLAKTGIYFLSGIFHSQERKR